MQTLETAKRIMLLVSLLTGILCSCQYQPEAVQTDEHTFLDGIKADVACAYFATPVKQSNLVLGYNPLDPRLETTLSIIAYVTSGRRQNVSKAESFNEVSSLLRGYTTSYTEKQAEDFSNLIDNYIIDNGDPYVGLSPLTRKVLAQLEETTATHLDPRYVLIYEKAVFENQEIFSTEDLKLLQQVLHNRKTMQYFKFSTVVRNDKTNLSCFNQAEIAGNRAMLAYRRLHLAEDDPFGEMDAYWSAFDATFFACVG